MSVCRAVIFCAPVALLTGCATVPSASLSTAGTVQAPPETRPAPAPAAQPGIARPEIWPAYKYPVAIRADDRKMIAGLLTRMTVEEKIGQLVQADLCCVKPEDLKRYKLGSILVGGSSGPNGNDLAPPPEWLKAADEFYMASVDKSDGGVGVPIIWGIDAVHGNSNIIGATIFPHNVGLGAARDPDMIERIGRATAEEIRVTGQEWTFAPTVTVPQDWRWGRAYEGYSSDAKLVASYVGAMVRGLQGGPDSYDLLKGPWVIASTKHFLADGGTENGTDQGNANISEEALRDIHGLPYGPAIENGVSTVMVSYSSWQGRKMTGNKSLLTDVLKDRMGFGGFVVSDWNAHAQLPGCSNEACPQPLLAGLDMYMAPDTWRGIYADLLARAKSGELPMTRVDDAVRRILEVKARLGLFKAGKPSSRPLSGEWGRLGSPQNRALAREAVRKSLVLLKNNGILPLKPGGRLLVAGEGADDIARQSGGWTISWQGTGLNNSQFPGATSLWSGFKQAVEAGGGKAELSPDGSFKAKPDAAIVVFGETPYAEFQGDRPTLTLDPERRAPFETMRKLKAQGIPVVAVMLTGRPLYVNPALNTADAFVTAWLPGSEGGGVADVLIGDRSGKSRFDFAGKLPVAWPRTVSMADGALFDFGYGLTYAAPGPAWSALPELNITDLAGDSRLWFTAGNPAARWSLLAGGDGNQELTRITNVPTQVADGRIRITAENYRVQEGARRFTVSGGPATVALRNFEAIDLDRETNANVFLLVTMRVWGAPDTMTIGARSGGTLTSVPIKVPAGANYVRYGIPLRCLRDKGVKVGSLADPFVLQTQGAADFAIGEVRLGSDAEVLLPCP